MEKGPQQRQVGIVDDIHQIIELKSSESAKMVTMDNLNLNIMIEYSNAQKIGISDTSFAPFTFKDIENNPEVLLKLIPYFKGKVVVDLGAGTNQWGLKIAKLLQCGAYIAVEPHFAQTLTRVFADEQEIPIGIIDEDGLSFLKKLQDQSVSIITFGTDNHMFPDESYNLKLCNEIRRCLANEGACLSGDSILKPAPQKDKPLKVEYLEQAQVYHY